MGEPLPAAPARTKRAPLPLMVRVVPLSLRMTGNAFGPSEVTLFSFANEKVQSAARVIVSSWPLLLAVLIAATRPATSPTPPGQAMAKLAACTGAAGCSRKINPIAHTARSAPTPLHTPIGLACACLTIMVLFFRPLRIAEYINPCMPGTAGRATRSIRGYGVVVERCLDYSVLAS